MNATTEEKQYRLDGLKWLIVFSLAVGAIYSNYLLSEEKLLYRAIAWVLIAVCIAFIGSKTKKGDSLIALMHGAYNEARRVVWPTRQERNQTTLMVVVVVLIMSLILWGLDTFFGWIASMVIG
jgi:preprotein translocase subunit SecE